MHQPSRTVRLRSPEGHAIVAAAVLGSGAVFVESTVVNVALPAIGRSLDLGMTGLQWIANAYLITLSALLLLGGALGDTLGQKRVFQAGLIAFSMSSLLCAVAPSFSLLIVARLLQGAAGAMLVPTSLAYLDTSFAAEERGEAIGQWAAWSAVWTAGGPLLGGALVDAASWRWVFAAASPLPLVALMVTLVGGQPRRAGSGRPVDFLGALLISAGLAILVWALLTAPADRAGRSTWIAAAVGLGLIGLFVRHEGRARAPLLPSRLFASRQFAGANAATLLIYAALGALFFLLMVQLQSVIGFTALAAGASLLPINACMLILSPLAGRWAATAGPGAPIASGAAVAALGLMQLSNVNANSAYLSGILPGIVFFGLGLGLIVAPLTSSVLAAVAEDEAGMASAVNNAAARLAGLLATAVIPLLVGLGGLEDLSGDAFARGYARAMWISAALCATGGVVAWSTVIRIPKRRPMSHPAPTHGCVPLINDRSGKDL